LNFICVNCSNLASVTSRSDEVTIYKCNDCEIEYRLLWSVEKQPTPRQISKDNDTITQETNRSATPIKVAIIHS
jgi:hypothetical protein